jgi:hypothetical protein
VPIRSKNPHTSALACARFCLHIAIELNPQITEIGKISVLLRRPRRPIQWLAQQLGGSTCSVRTLVYAHDYINIIFQNSKALTIPSGDC